MSSPYTGDSPFVYISYVREDHAMVVDEIDRLCDLGIRCFWDTSDDADADRLKEAAFFLALVSDGTEDSDALLKEVGMALRESKDTACLHLADVPLGGKAELLLKGITDVKKYRMSDALYMRWLSNSLPDSVKTKDIPIPKEEPRPKSTSAPRPRGGGGIDGPPLMDRLKEVDPKIWAVVGGFTLLCVIALTVMAISNSSTSGTETASKTDAKTAADDSDDPAVKKARAEAEAREAARTKQAEATQRREEAKWQLRQKLRKGEDKFNDEDWEGAIKALTEGIDQPELAREKLADDLGKAYLLRGKAYVKKRARKEAIADFRRYLKLKEKDADTWYQLAGMLKQLKRFKEAITAYDQVVKLQPKRALGWRYRADCYRRLKKYNEALADYTKNIEVDPRDAAAYRYRARVKRALGDEQGASDDMAKSSELLNR